MSKFMVVKKDRNVGFDTVTVFKGSLNECEEYMKTLITPTSNNYDGLIIDGKVQHFINKVW